MSTTWNGQLLLEYLTFVMLSCITKEHVPWNETYTKQFLISTVRNSRIFNFWFNIFISICKEVARIRVPNIFLCPNFRTTPTITTTEPVKPVLSQQYQELEMRERKSK